MHKLVLTIFFALTMCSSTRATFIKTVSIQKDYPVLLSSNEAGVAVSASKDVLAESVADVVTAKINVIKAFFDSVLEAKIVAKTSLLPTVTYASGGVLVNEPGVARSYVTEPISARSNANEQQVVLRNYAGEPVIRKTYAINPVYTKSYASEPATTRSYGQTSSYSSEPVFRKTFAFDPIFTKTYTSGAVNTPTTRSAYSNAPVGAQSYAASPVFTKSYGIEPFFTKTYSKGLVSSPVVTKAYSTGVVSKPVFAKTVNVGYQPLYVTTTAQTQPINSGAIATNNVQSNGGYVRYVRRQY